MVLKKNGNLLVVYNNHLCAIESILIIYDVHVWILC